MARPGSDSADLGANYVPLAASFLFDTACSEEICGQPSAFAQAKSELISRKIA
jgi:hypothetical protein